MTNYFETSEGEEIEEMTEFTNSGLPKTIPDNTTLHCIVAGAEWVYDKYSDAESLVIKLHIIEKGQYKDTLKDHKLHLNHSDSKKSDKARKFLSVYDVLCGGKLRKLGKRIDTSEGVSRALSGTEVLITFGLIEGEYVNNSGETVPTANNWVMSVKDTSNAIHAVSDKPKETKKPEPVDDSYRSMTDDDIQF